MASQTNGECREPITESRIGIRVSTITNIIIALNAIIVIDIMTQIVGHAALTQVDSNNTMGIYICILRDIREGSFLINVQDLVTAGFWGSLHIAIWHNLSDLISGGIAQPGR